jgi:hypothetical protein
MVRAIACMFIIALTAGWAHAQERLSGAALAVKSVGERDGASWTLTENGFVGTYIHLDAPGRVTLIVTASGLTQDRTAPRMEVAVGDAITPFTITLGWDEHRKELDLGAGTHFVRIALTNAGNLRTLNVHRLQVHGAQARNEHTDANALAAADAYIEHGRRGTATLHVPGAAPGQSVRVTLRRHEFLFGAAVHGVFTNVYLIDNPQPGTDPWRMQAFIRENFNSLTPENAGKWASNESTRGELTLNLLDAILTFARRHGMSVRMHALIWETEQEPQWARDLLTKAGTRDHAAARELRRAISNRIRYYVRDRAA